MFIEEFIEKECEILIDKKDAMNMLNILNDADVIRYTIKSCGWAKAPDCWFVHFRANNRKWVTVLQMMKQRDVEFLPPTVAY